MSSTQQRKRGKAKRGRAFASNNRQERLPPANMTSAQFNMPMTVSFPKNVIGFPDRLQTILKYSQQNTYGGASPTPTAQIFALNSAYDPDSSGAGHQPSFYDTFSAVYGRYFVKAFKLEVEIINLNAGIGIFAVANYADQNISGNTVEQIVEAKYSKWTTLSVNTGNKAVAKISLPWMSTMKLMGQPGTEADDNMYAQYNASPSDVAWGAIKMAAVDGVTNMQAIGRVTLLQEVIFKDLLPQISS